MLSTSQVMQILIMSGNIFFMALILLISLENTSLSTSIFDNTIGLNRKLIYETNLLGQKIKGSFNQPKLFIYDDGTVDKRVVID